ncbi:hypothetical protein PspLS_08720 [Pyricularia sp. CBS 133598]|nr:hypothetical protein PspLS_08720 [Pyricularia sp. CBS 133598]
MASLPSPDVAVDKPCLAQPAEVDQQPLAPKKPDTLQAKVSEQDEAQNNSTFQRANDQDHQEPTEKQTGSAALMEEIHMLREKLFKLGDRVADHMGHEIDEDQETDTTKDPQLVNDSIKRSRRHCKATKWGEKRETRAAELQETVRKVRGIPMMSFIEPDGKEGYITSSVQYRTDREHDTYWDLREQSHRFGGTRISTTTGRLAPMVSLQKQQSRKLGPPTQWDTFDSDQWDSDDTTKTKDFDYFRARLRGDFEWEIERLMAQKERYDRNKAKRKALAVRGRNTRSQEPGESEQHALPTIFESTWPDFKAMWDQPIQTAFAIDVLIGEPRITLARYFDNDLRSINRRRKQTAVKEPEASSGSSFPERIRIHSNQIIQTLSVICGKKLSGDNVPIVLLRPFRLLAAYATDIREWHSNLIQAPEAFMVSQTTADNERKSETAGTEITHTDNTESIPSGNTKPSDVAADENNKENDAASKIDPKGYSRSKETAAHLGCLIEFMDTYIVKRQAYLNSSSCSKVLFSDLWHLFKPGDFVISTDRKQVYQVFRVDLEPHRGVDPWDAFFQKSNDSDSDDSKGSDSHITILCVHISFDGYQLGPVTNRFHIDSFSGERAATSLVVYPLRLHHQKDIETRATVPQQSEQAAEDDLKRLRERLIQRGRLFVDVAGIKHKYYAGLTVGMRDEVESQVMIDFQEAFAVEENKDWAPMITRLAGQPDKRAVPACTLECCFKEYAPDDSFVDYSRYRDFTQRLMPAIEGNHITLPSVTVFPRLLKDIATNGNNLTDDELLIMSYKVPGFVLRDRTWAWLDLDYLSDVVSSAEDGKANSTSSDDDEEDHSAFGQLVLPEGHKDMVLSLVSQHFRNKHRAQGKDEQTDIVRGKGKGLIILLHGAPGVGKTTTAEGVAGRFKKPLLQITCGDLGSNAADVESALRTNFSLASKWDCVLLLDEADVFLAERRRTDFHRNGLVAVFLRVLEYYAGILFLTTNRIGDFDEAFASRIHMSLHYPQLTEISTIKVFKLNLRMIKNRYASRNRKIKIDEDEIIQTAGAHWRNEPEARLDGRQIKNACQTALALAEYEAQPEGAKFDLSVDNEDRKVHLTVAYLNKVTQAYLDFMKYLKAVHGTDAERRARENGLRALESMAATFANKEAVNATRGHGLAAWNISGGSQQRSPSPGNPPQHQTWSNVFGYGQAAYAQDPRGSATRNYERGYQTQVQPGAYTQEQ